MSRKGLLTKLGEVLDQHRAEQQSDDKVLEKTIGRVSKYFWFPTPGNVIFTLLVIASLLWAQNVGAISLGAPTAATTSITGIPYQGRLADKNGAPLTQTVNMTFRLYAATSGGSPLWEEPWTGANSVQVSDGLFNVMLGSLTQIPQAVITGNNNLFLGITVGTDSEMSPRVQLGSVPFATQALTVPDGSITKAKLASDVNLVPGDGIITESMLADKSVSRRKLSIGNLVPVTVGNFTYVPSGTTSSEIFRVNITDLGLQSRPIGIAQVTDGSYRNDVLIHYRYDSSSATEAQFEFFRPGGLTIPAANLRVNYVLFGQ